MEPTSLNDAIIRNYVQTLHHLTGIPLSKLQRYGTTNSLMNALEHPHTLELTAKQLQKVEQLNAFLQSHRVLQWEEENAKQSISSPEMAGSYFSAFLSDLKDRERFLVAFLDSGNHIIETRILSEGGIDQTPIYPRNVLKAALNCDCASMIFAHNHPGGNMRPSSEDVTLTERMIDIFEPLGIHVLDHIIISGTRYTSLAQCKQMPIAAEKAASYESIALHTREEFQDYTVSRFAAVDDAHAPCEDEWER
ncbi:MAG: repair protein [Paenibacillaceae bacterium]|jgi:DNA repair protein RadC|nr:repair protein [Paenibacillaceae bacterium]